MTTSCCQPPPDKTTHSKLEIKDYWTHFLIRIGVDRDNRKVNPGLYRLGHPTKQSPVLVSANYQLSFDYLRSDLNGKDAWILVIDTKGINVWCAAGKGTFGTAEICQRVSKVSLAEIVDHKKIILPQLGAPAVCAHQVKEETGFNVIYGPVRSKDLPKFLDNGFKTDEQMRRVHFTLWDRFVLTPIEAKISSKHVLFIGIATFIIAGLQKEGILFARAWKEGVPLLFCLLIAWLVGTVLTPVFLPYIPFKRFTVKGWLLCAPFILIIAFSTTMIDHWSRVIGAILLYPTIAAYLAFNFTGCSTYTSPSGVKKEMRETIRPMFAFALAGSILMILSLWGVL